MRTGRPRRDIWERLFERVQVNTETDCWEWTGHVPKQSDKLKYGRIKTGGNTVPEMVHRVVYELLVGPIPDGLVVDHICRNAKCCNWKHLRLLTPSENSDGGFVKKFREAEKCANGHPWIPENTIPRKLHGEVIGRYCRVCRTHGPTKDALLIKLGLPLED